MSDTNTRGDQYAIISFRLKRDGDSVTDACMTEIAERLQVAFEDSGLTGLYRGETPPTDTSLIWQPTDADDVPIGGTMVYDPSTETWVTTTETTPVSQVISGYQAITGNGDIQINFGAAMPSSAYWVEWQFTNYNGVDWTGTFDAAIALVLKEKTENYIILTASGHTGTDSYIFWRVS